ncbi:MAG: PhzF family phenazine biosynthesis protein [Mesorhizobium sp.]|nr:PhzF family phenazine biosynthesis protein [Mesorhizobium sp.]MBL8575929.1 PhzF family phenazine biosynthesis protein [Mesorhizobium sp.]
MKSRQYFVYDVFADSVLSGNPLAVVMDAEGLDDDRMQAIAREFNLSETVFVLPPKNPIHKASIRIFMPRGELPFAGHPTVGTAVALAERVSDNAAAGILVLEEKVGPVRCVVTRGAGGTFAEFDLPKLPARLEASIDASAVAAALGLGPHEIGFENHRLGVWSAGVPYVTVPVAGLDEAGRAAVDAARWLDIAPRIGCSVPAPYVYCRETVGHDCAFHARMFSPWDGIAEDPATGSAAAAFAGAIHHFDRPVDGQHRLWIEQGIEMGRPSRIRLEIDVATGHLTHARIGGHATKVAEGLLYA